MDTLNRMEAADTARTDAPVLVIATDASGRGSGSWAWIRPDGLLAFGEPQHENLTVDDLDLMAIFEALRATRKGSTVHLRVDSKLALSRICHKVRTTGATFTPPRRLRGGWAQRVIQLAETRDVTAHWVRGHSTDALNQAADRLAALGSKEDSGPVAIARIRDRLARELGMPGAIDASSNVCECGVPLDLKAAI